MLPSSLAPESYLAMATGAPVETPVDQTTNSIIIPTEGAHQVAASSDGTTSLMWIRSVVAPVRRRDRFIRTLEAGLIPSIMRAPPNRIAFTRTYYLSLDELQSCRSTLVEILGLTEGLIKIASNARMARCSICGELLPIFAAASELLAEISRTWQGRNIHIELRGPGDEIRTWAQGMGFAASTASDGIATARLDAFSCEATRCLELQPLIESTRRVRDGWIAVHDGADTAEYSWHGRCRSCRTQKPPFRRALLREALQRGEPTHAQVEMSRVIAGISIHEVMKLSLERFIALPEAEHLFSPKQRSAMHSLGLGSLSLTDRASSLSPQIISKLPLLSHAGHQGEQGDLFLIDPPSAIMSAGEELSFRTVTDSLAERAPLVWLRDPCVSYKPIHTENPEATVLGTLLPRDGSSPPIEIRCGEWRNIDIPHTSPNERPSHIVAAAIDGEANHAYEFAATGPFSPHLIPLFSVDSNLTRLVAHDLGVNDPLAKLFASSQQAKMLGLTPRDLIIGQARVSASICRTCRGAGLLLTEEDSVLSGASLCTSCWGARWSSPARDITFRGKTMWQLLNSPIRETAPVLRALPKMSQILELVTLLDLVDIPLGMPTSLLSRTNRRLLSVIKATISATPSRPSLVILEEPYVGLTEKQISGLAEVALHSYTKQKVAWIAVSGSEASPFKNLNTY